MKTVLIRCDQCSRSIVEGPDELCTVTITNGVEADKQEFHFCSHCQPTAETRVKELEADASRYRYLRNSVPVDGELCIVRKSYDGRHTYLTLDERDRLIDAELDKLKGTK